MNHSNRIPVPAPALLLLGPTGSGKTPLGDTVAARGLLGVRAHHLDFGAELRAVAAGNGAGGAYTPGELDFIQGVLERGLLLENEHFALAEKIIGHFLVRSGFGAGHLLVLNGIPRHTGQARDMERIADVVALVVLDCAAEHVVCRLRDNVGRDRTERGDDHDELVGKKLAIFRERTSPLIAHYENRGSRIYRLTMTGTTTADEAYERLSALVALDPPVTLVAEPPER